MEVVKFEGVDTIAVAKDCFDLPLAQCVDMCDKCAGSGKAVAIPDDGVPACEDTKAVLIECPGCRGEGVVRVRLISSWRFTEEEFQYMVDHPEARGVFLSVVAAKTPPVFISVGNPLEMWPDSVITVKQFMQKYQSNG